MGAREFENKREWEQKKAKIKLEKMGARERKSKSERQKERAR